MPELQNIITKVLRESEIALDELQQWALIQGIQAKILDAQRSYRKVTIAPNNFLVNPLEKDDLLHEAPIYDETLRSVELGGPFVAQPEPRMELAAPSSDESYAGATEEEEVDWCCDDPECEVCYYDF